MSKKDKIIWVSPKYSDSLYTGIDFYDVISLYEENQPPRDYTGKRAEDFDREFDRYFEEHSDVAPEDVKFYFYNPRTVYLMAHAPSCLFKCVNPPQILSLMSQKNTFRDLAGAHSIPYELVDDADDLMSTAARLFDEHGHIVVQECSSAGGKGTWFISSATELTELFSMSNIEFPVIISRFLPDSISINTHVIVYENGILIEPGSVQLLQGSRYRGADFALYRQLPEDLRVQFETQCSQFAQEIAQQGYRGVLGIDGLISHGEVFLLECNARFQGSTLVLNIMHERAGLPSIHQLNMEAFQQPAPEMVSQSDLDALNDYLYSVSVYSYSPKTYPHAMELWKLYDKSDEHLVFSDALIPEDESQIKEQEILYRVVYDHSIACLEDNQTRVRICEGPNTEKR